MSSRKLKLGDIVFCQRGNILLGDTYQHYGVYAGYHKIIHYIKGDSPFDGRIAETSIETFCDGDTLYIAEEDTLLSIFQDAGVAASFYGPRKTVQRAKSMIGKGGYNLLTHNCEHFAVWCKTGLEVSTQASISGVLIKGIEPDGIIVGTIFRLLRNHIWRVEAEY